jgi:hypothetical protein
MRGYHAFGTPILRSAKKAKLWVYPADYLGVQTKAQIFVPSSWKYLSQRITRSLKEEIQLILRHSNTEYKCPFSSASVSEQ